MKKILLGLLSVFILGGCSSSPVSVTKEDSAWHQVQQTKKMENKRINYQAHNGNEGIDTSNSNNFYLGETVGLRSYSKKNSSFSYSSFEKERKETLSRLCKEVSENKKEIRSCSSLLQGQIPLFPVFFDVGSSLISESFYSILDQTATFMNLNPGFTLNIVGFTDDTGTQSVNDVLANSRAASIVNYLVNKGVDPLRLSSDGKGKTGYLLKNVNKENRGVNRRASIILQFDKEMKTLKSN